MNGLSQEELAEKLNVSRQSVSKWESNSTYPETDKIVQICNLFDCSMDDLINDKIIDIEKTMRKNKNGFNDAIDSLLDFITKTVHMFYHMKFTSGLKCILEIVVLAFLLFLTGLIVGSILTSVVSNLFHFLGGNVTDVVHSLLKGIFDFLWLILSTIVIIHTFKLRYLDYYDEVQDVKKDKIDFVDNKQKIIIRDQHNKPFVFLSLLSRIFMFGVKFCLFWILLFLVGLLVMMIIGDVFSLYLISVNSIFIGTSFTLISITIFFFQLLILGILFMVNKKPKWMVHIIFVILMIVLCGVGISFTVLSLKKIEIIQDVDMSYYEEQSLKLKYKDNLVIEMRGNGRVNEYFYVVDDSMPDGDIVVSKKIDTRFYVLKEDMKRNQSVFDDRMNSVTILEMFNGNYREQFNIILKDLKKNQIHTDYGIYQNEEILHIKANPNTLNLLKENLKKMYLIEEKEEENKTHIFIRDFKVFFPYGVEGYYDARDDSLHLETANSHYGCIRSSKNTEWGEQIIFSCKDNRYDE